MFVSSFGSLVHFKGTGHWPGNKTFFRHSSTLFKLSAQPVSLRRQQAFIIKVRFRKTIMDGDQVNSHHSISPLTWTSNLLKTKRVHAFQKCTDLVFIFWSVNCFALHSLNHFMNPISGGCPNINSRASSQARSLRPVQQNDMRMNDV